MNNINPLAIIGSSRLAKLSEFVIHRRQIVRTPYGLPDAPLLFGKIGERDIVLLARQGLNHTVSPEAINYRANVWALQEVGAKQIISVSSVCATGDVLVDELVLPHDLIDYTSGRADTFADGRQEVQYTDFRQPYDENLRQQLIELAKTQQLALNTQAIYACVQGARLPTGAEIRRMQRDGVDVYGMTGMPEAVLARELNLPYVHVCGVVGAGVSGESPFSSNNPHHAVVMAKIRDLFLQLDKLGA